ncbi:MAG: hypothetical protein UH625_04445 [Muribaculaceae bacterium]|nr:hypothetical protein [Muribaculaceae bacterium]
MKMNTPRFLLLISTLPSLIPAIAAEPQLYNEPLPHPHSEHQNTPAKKKNY